METFDQVYERLQNYLEEFATSIVEEHIYDYEQIDAVLEAIIEELGEWEQAHGVGNGVYNPDKLESLAHKT